MRSLTGRGRVLLAIGVVTGVAGWSIDQPALIAVALLLVLVPVLGMLAVRRSRFVLGSARTVTPTRIPFGGEAEVVLTVENGSRLTSGALLLEDTVPPSLGEPRRGWCSTASPRAPSVPSATASPVSERGRTAGRAADRARHRPVRHRAPVPVLHRHELRRGHAADRRPRRGRREHDARWPRRDDAALPRRARRRRPAPPRAPRRRRHAPHPLARDRAPGRAHGAPRGAGLAQLDHRRPRRPRPRAPRHRLVVDLRVGRLRGRERRRALPAPGLAPHRPDIHRPACWSTRGTSTDSDARPRAAGVRRRPAVRAPRWPPPSASTRMPRPPSSPCSAA